jgi:agmatinase
VDKQWVRFSVVDCGDVDFNVGYPERMIEAVEQAAGRILDAGVSLLGLGGDHFVSYPLLRVQAARHGPLSLVHLDAHSDTWASEDYNHGTMFYHAAKEGLIDPAHSIQIGIRTPNPDTHGLTIVNARELLDQGPRDTECDGLGAHPGLFDGGFAHGRLLRFDMGLLAPLLDQFAAQR